MSFGELLQGELLALSPRDQQLLSTISYFEGRTAQPPDSVLGDSWSKLFVLLVFLQSLCQVPQQARAVLPNSLKTEIVMTANLREWRHFFKLRTSQAAHPQMRDLALQALMMFKEAVPVLFEDYVV